MKIASKLGIFGGTFAPVHTGHVNAAQAFWSSGLIDRLLIMPTFIPPHKTIDFQDDPKDRINMLRIAFADFASLHPASFEISDYEIQKGTISYTVQTLKHYRSLCDSITLLCGTDMFLSIESWYHAKELLQMCELAYAARSRNESENSLLRRQAQNLKKRYGVICHALPCRVIEISSSTLRNKISHGENTSDYLHPGVKQYIDEKQLYRSV